MLVTNGTGYDSLREAYERGEISQRSEIIVDFKRKKFFDNYVPEASSIAFNKKGVLHFVNHDSDPSIGRALNLNDLTRIGGWGAVVLSQEREKYETRFRA